MLNNSRRGVVAIYVLLIAAFFMTVAITFLALNLANIQDSSNLVDAASARLLAQSALQEGNYYYLYLDPNWSGTSSEQTVTLGGKTFGTYEYGVAKCGGKYTVTGYGYVPSKQAKNKASKSLSLTLYNPYPYSIFSDDFESGSLSQWSESNDSNTDWDVQTIAPKVGTYHARAVRTSGGGGTLIARLLTPTLNLSCYTQVILRFSYRRNLGSRFLVYQNSTGSDTSGWVQIFNDSSSTYEGVYITPAQQLTITNLTSTVSFRFEGHMSANGQEWYLDEVLLTTPYALYNAGVDR